MDNKPRIVWVLLEDTTQFSNEEIFEGRIVRETTTLKWFKFHLSNNKTFTVVVKGVLTMFFDLSGEPSGGKLAPNEMILYDTFKVLGEHQNLGLGGYIKDLIDIFDKKAHQIGESFIFIDTLDFKQEFDEVEVPTGFWAKITQKPRSKIRLFKKEPNKDGDGTEMVRYTRLGQPEDYVPVPGQVVVDPSNWVLRQEEFHYVRQGE